jgi:hypothetical protein
MANSKVDDDGGSAFPVVQQHLDNPLEWGMSLRDYFAAAAIQGILAAEDGFPDSVEYAAEVAYNVADAMLAERSPKK